LSVKQVVERCRRDAEPAMAAQAETGSLRERRPGPAASAPTS
jgi:hypothetical protein